MLRDRWGLAMCYLDFLTSANFHLGQYSCQMKILPQIICLIVETYNKLAASINVDEHPLSTQIFWEKATVIMTDSVSKNLKISEGTEKFFNPCI